MGVIETKLFLSVSDFYPDFYVRYVGDCFAVLFCQFAEGSLANLLRDDSFLFVKVLTESQNLM